MDQLTQLFQNGNLRQIPKGQIVIYEGDPVSNLYFLDSGYVKVYNIQENDVERIIFIYGPGDIFPMTTYLSGAGSTRYFYQTMTRAAARLISPEHVKRQIRGNLELGEQLMHYTDQMNQQFARRIDMLAISNAKAKVRSLLEFLVDKAAAGDQPGRIELPLTAQNIADMCGLTRETAHKKLSELKKEGVVSGSKIMTVDKAKLMKQMQASAF